MNKTKYIKLIIIAAGMLISAAFYMLSPEGKRLFAEENEVVFLEMENERELTEEEETRGGTEVPGTNETTAAGWDKEELQQMEEIVRLAVREELIDICRDGYLEKALEESAGLAAAEAEARKGMVNINTADKKELMSLEGIGQKRAEDILTYRAENGDFQSPEDIMNVSGIKRSVYEKIKDKIYTL